jgi:hypothetical protein
MKRAGQAEQPETKYVVGSGEVRGLAKQTSPTDSPGHDCVIPNPHPLGICRNQVFAVRRHCHPRNGGPVRVAVGGEGHEPFPIRVPDPDRPTEPNTESKVATRIAGKPISGLRIDGDSRGGSSGGA